MSPIILIACTWAILLAVFIGIGLCGLRFVGDGSGVRNARPGHDGARIRGETTQQPIPGSTVVHAMWLGFALVIVLIQIWHLWQPLGGGIAATIVGALGLLGIIIRIRGLTHGFVDRLRRHYIAMPFLILLIAWAAHRSAGPCTCPDSGLYHVNAVKWSAQYPIILGIANLHERLAFNNANLLLAGMLEFGIWSHRSHNLVNGLLVAMLMITATSAIARGWRRRSRLGPDHVFGAVLLTVAMLFALHRQAFNISSHSSNLAAAVTVMAALYLTLSELLRPRSTWGTSQSNFAVLSATALLAASVTIKLSVVVTCGLTWIILVATWRRRNRKMGAPTATALIVFVVSSTLLIGPWIVRTVLLSGYPIFPKSAFRFDVDWAYPAEQTQYAEELITTWAQNKAHPGEIRGWSWLRPWWMRLMRMSDRYEAVVVPIWIAAGGMAVMLLRIHRVWRYRAVAMKTLWLLPPIIAGMIFWFFVAPDPRFALYLFYSFAALIIAVALGTCARSRRGIAKRTSLVMCMLLALTPIAYRLDPKYYLSDASLGRRLTDLIFIKPGPVSGFYKLPPPKQEKRTTDFGLEVFVIKPGGATWDGPLVSTPKGRYTPRLRLRDPEIGVRGGFRIEPDKALDSPRTNRP